MFKFSEFINESLKEYYISFEYNGEKIEFKSTIFRKIYTDTIFWLYNNGYKFDENVVGRRLYKKSEISKSYLNKGLLYQIPNEDLYMIVNVGNEQSIKYAIVMLKRFGVKSDTIDTNCLKSSSESDLEVDDIETDIETESDRVIPPTEFIKTPEKPKVYVKNPFGCKQKDGSETSALCVIGKSGSGKTTSTEIALESMEHEYLLYIPIEGEYTFSQYTGEEFEMSSLGEFMMMAQNNPSKCYTVIFDECHRPITISKLNTDLLQALSSKRNRGGDRFVTIDRSTKRMYTTPTEEFPIPLKEKSGKVLVPDNFGIVCLSSNPAVICRNDDFLNRVDLVVFHQSDREVQDLTKLKKLEPIEKNIESIRGLLLSDGKQEL